MGLDLLFDVLDEVRGLCVDGDGLSGRCRDEHRHAARREKRRWRECFSGVRLGGLLPVVARAGSRFLRRVLACDGRLQR